MDWTGDLLEIISKKPLRILVRSKIPNKEGKEPLRSARSDWITMGDFLMWDRTTIMRGLCSEGSERKSPSSPLSQVVSTSSGKQLITMRVRCAKPFGFFRNL